MNGVVALNKSFDRIADQYDRARPTYPDSIFDRVIELAGIDSAARVLEVGTGTGKATVPMARRGFRILALEPGPSLAEIARARLVEYANVEVQTVSFEDWQPPLDAFDLAFAAQAFHWLAPAERLPKFARVLRRAGTLAVFGNAEGVIARPLHDAIQAAYLQHAPSLGARSAARHAYGSEESPLFQELRSSPLFTDAHAEFTRWNRTFSSDDYCALLATYSDHSTLPPTQLRDLSSSVARAIDERGGTVAVEYRTGLFLARAAER
ncbi:MAG TPA: class I SAM-dependent methyltransferase [Polyangiaceae bacterium]|jgi:SAM-dependent methyltransferase|nr:class I SAM-dependent methyltransferase [Polyangiaceae bacterium]